MLDSAAFGQATPHDENAHRAMNMTGSIRNAQDRREAARLIKAGKPVGVFARGVYVIVVNGQDQEAVATIQRVKGERRTGKPMAALIPLATLISLIDAEQIPQALHRFFLDPKELEARLGTLCSIRVPFRSQAAAYFPSSLIFRDEVGNQWVQSWVAGGASPASLLLNDLQEQGIAYPGVSSMNTSGEPEVVDPRHAEAFCSAQGISLLLNDPKANGRVKGSFPILQVDSTGVHLIREGHFDRGLFRHLLDGVVIDDSHAVRSKYPLMPTDSLDTLSPYRLHDQLVELMDGDAPSAAISDDPMGAVSTARPGT